MTALREERAFDARPFFDATFDLPSKMFWRFDARVLVDCNIVIDTGTEQLAFTGCWQRRGG